MRIKISIIVTSLLSVLFISAPVLAISANAQSNSQKPTTTPTERANGQAIQRQEAVKNKLSEAKLKLCRNRERNVNGIMSRISDRGQKQLELFNKISERTQEFYKAKGNTLTNYDVLVADVNAQKQQAQTAVSTIKDTSTTFKCDGSDPKGAANSFKVSLKAEIEALKTYKTAVKNLIVGVKSVQPTASTLPSPTPTANPEGVQ